MVMAFVIVTAPNPPGSRQLISPAGAVFEIAPAKVLHGAVRLHGLASSPTPDTHVRVACALASAQAHNRTTTAAILLNINLVIITNLPFLNLVGEVYGEPRHSGPLRNGPIPFCVPKRSGVTSYTLRRW